MKLILYKNLYGIQPVAVNNWTDDHTHFIEQITHWKCFPLQCTRCAGSDGSISASSSAGLGFNPRRGSKF